MANGCIECMKAGHGQHGGRDLFREAYGCTSGVGRGRMGSWSVYQHGRGHECMGYNKAGHGAMLAPCESGKKVHGCMGYNMSGCGAMVVSCWVAGRGCMREVGG